MIIIKQGDATTITETITGLSSLGGYEAKLFLYERDDTAIDIIDGTIDGLEIEYDILNDDSKDYPLGIHKYESKIFDDTDHTYTTSTGPFVVEPTIVTEPDGIT